MRGVMEALAGEDTDLRPYLTQQMEKPDDH